jgi:4-hydroxy-tetrahydrodipicolinate synthase
MTPYAHLRSSNEVKPMRGSNARFGHVLTAMVTPFDRDGRVDLVRAGELARWLLDNGSDGLVLNGTTGESPTTSTDEKIALIRAVRQTLGPDALLMAGAGGNNTAEVVELARLSHEAGASALLSVAPYYNKPSQEGLYRHFRAVADATPLPVVLYNVPGRTITNIEATTTARLARDAATIVGTKEASANLAQVGEIVRTTPDDFDVYSGDDGTVLPTLALGGAGVISVISHVVGPDLARVHRAWFAGETAEAARRFLPLLPVTRALFSARPRPDQVCPVARRPAVGGVRLPLVDLTEDEQRVVAEGWKDTLVHQDNAG